MRGPRSKTAGIIGACVVAALFAIWGTGARECRADDIDQRRLEYEFARFVAGRLDSEREVRAAIVKFLEENRGPLADGLGRHPELVPPLMEAAGLGRMNCISGWYFPVFKGGLDKDGLTFFYGVKEQLDHWATMIAVEEAARRRVYSPSPPMSYRRRSDYPPFIALALREVIGPYLNRGPGAGTGAGYDGLACE